MSDEKITYVLGHRNPDTDSIVSAIAYAELKSLQGLPDCRPARAGKVNPQTEYILERFGVAEPEFISELIPRVANHMSHHPITVTRESSLWKALEILDGSGHRMLPVVDGGGRLDSILHYNAFARNILKKINPSQRPVIPTSLALLEETLGGRLLNEKDRDTIFEGRIVVAASDIDSLGKYIDAIPKENCIVMVGNRRDLQDCVIEKGVRCLIVTGSHTISEEQLRLALKNGVSVLLSPFDTVTTSALALYSTPVMHMGDRDVQPVKQDHYIKSVRKPLSETPSRALPVVDDEGIVIGVISQGDLMREPNLEFIMVDHNEVTQAPEGIENYRILEIIDHHRLGNLHTSRPITFINKPVGSTSTIVASLFLEQKQEFSATTAALLLSGILSDTLALRSATTTEEDVRLSSYLAEKARLDIQQFGSEILAASSKIGSRPAAEIISMDLKKYSHGDSAYTVSQVEVSSLDDIRRRSGEILGELESMRTAQNLLFATIMVTDITTLNSALFIKGDMTIIREIAYPKMEESVFLLKGIVSRKKQLLPYLTDLLKALS
jgi:manganese-dependent inorganic pyrophosphatase